MHPEVGSGQSGSDSLWRPAFILKTCLTQGSRVIKKSSRRVHWSVRREAVIVGSPSLCNATPPLQSLSTFLSIHWFHFGRKVPFCHTLHVWGFYVQFPMQFITIMVNCYLYTGLSTEPLTLNISCSINSAKKKSCRSLNLDPAIDFLALFLFHGNVILDSPTAHPPHYNWELWLCWKQLRHHDQRCFSVTQIVFGQQPFSFSKQNCCCWKVFKGRKGDEEGMVWGVGNWIEDRGGWNSLGEQLSEDAADLCCNSPSIRLHQTTTSSEKYTSQTGRNALLQRAQKCLFKSITPKNCKIPSCFNRAVV